MSLLDTRDLAEISHANYPGERGIACRTPPAATETELATIAAAVKAGRLAGRIGIEVGKYEMAEHFDLAVIDDDLAYARRRGRP